MLQAASEPLSHSALCQRLQLKSDEHQEALRRRLIAMSRDGQLASERNGTFQPMDQVQTLIGTVQGHREGFGFVLFEEDHTDMYLSKGQMRQVIDGDRVRVRSLGFDHRGKEEAAIVEVLERNTLQLVGRLFHQSGEFFVTPEHKRQAFDVRIPADRTAGAVTGQLVQVELIEQPSRQQTPIGHVTEVLGDPLDPGLEIDLALRTHKIPHQWPDDVLQQMEQIPEKVSEGDKKHRIDLRDLPFVTIDGEDARDFDDAVFCVANPKTGGWRLYVAIADVSHYVGVDSALDQEAWRRGNSVYFPGQVVPMLPEKLSNGLCSLNPKVDRLVMVCEMTVSQQGRLSGYQFYEGVIHSQARLTYTQVSHMLEERSSDAGKDQRKANKSVLEPLETLYKLYKTLRKAREQRGAMDFDTVETQILFDAQRKIEAIVPQPRNDAHKLIEECMLLANVATARFLQKHEIPALYRVHEGPSVQRLQNLTAFLNEIGLKLEGAGAFKTSTSLKTTTRSKTSTSSSKTSKTAKPTPKAYNKLLKQIQGRPDQHIIQTVLLRSLSQANYRPDNLGHFGLNYPAYTHFTSPIRRYPDLLVHRALRSVIRGRNPDATNIKRTSGTKAMAKRRIYPYDLTTLLALGEHCSMTERRADEVSRDVVSFLKCEYIYDHIGQSYPGVISAVTSFGIFVELQDLYVEGLVHIANLRNDYFRYNAIRHQLIGERSGAIFALGDRVEVKVANVDLNDRKIDFDLVEGGRNRKQRRKDNAKAAANAAGSKRSASAKKSTSTKKSASAKKSTSTKKSASAKKSTASKKSGARKGQKSTKSRRKP